MIREKSTVVIQKLHEKRRVLPDGRYEIGDSRLVVSVKKPPSF